MLTTASERQLDVVSCTPCASFTSIVGILTGNFPLYFCCKLTKIFVSPRSNQVIVLNKECADLPFYSFEIEMLLWAVSAYFFLQLNICMQD